jgi:hypothetical protein
MSKGPYYIIQIIFSLQELIEIEIYVGEFTSPKSAFERTSKNICFFLMSSHYDAIHIFRDIILFLLCLVVGEA